MHPIRSLFQTISLYDDLIIEPKDEKGIRIICEDESLTQKNLLIDIYHYFQDNISKGLVVTLIKNIPMGAGLGGGSSNAAAFLNYLNETFQWRMDLDALTQAAMRFGSDIPFFLTGGTALVEGVGDQITQVETKVPNYLVLVNPGLHSDSKKAYQAFDALEKYPKPGDDIGVNHLQRPVFNLIPELETITNSLSTLTQKQFFMTGSGSTLFLPVESFDDGENIVGRIKKTYPDFFIKTVSPVGNY